MFHPVVDRWFQGRFQAPTPAQVRAWPAIAEGRDALIAAPTGSGKTLAGFLVFGLAGTVLAARRQRVWTMDRLRPALTI